VAGAIVSTILTLIVVPLLYYMIEKHKYENKEVNISKEEESNIIGK